MKKLLSTKWLIVRGIALLAFLSIIAGNSYLYADTPFSDSSHANVCTFCLFSNSKEEGNGNKVPTPNSHFHFSHCPCDHQQTVTGTLALFGHSGGHRFKPFEDMLVPFQLAASIFRPPKVHI